MAAYGGGSGDVPGAGGAVVGGNAYEQDVMQYMDDDWWRQPKGEGEQGSGGGGEGVVGQVVVVFGGVGRLVDRALA